MNSVTRRKVVAVMATSAMAVGGIAGSLTAMAQGWLESEPGFGMNKYKAYVSKASIQEIALSDFDYVAEGVQIDLKELGEELSAEEAASLQKFYLDQTIETTGQYYNFYE